jgi:hypothetical protein
MKELVPLESHVSFWPKELSFRNVPQYLSKLRALPDR